MAFDQAGHQGQAVAVDRGGTLGDELSGRARHAADAVAVDQHVGRIGVRAAAVPQHGIAENDSAHERSPLILRFYGGA